MNSLLKMQLQKVYGKDFHLKSQDKEFKKILKLVSKSYKEQKKAFTNNEIKLKNMDTLLKEKQKLQKDIEYKNIMLIQQNKFVSMGEMIANIAHQWRQPLNTLGLLIQKMGIFYKQGLLDTKQIDENITKAMFLMNGMSETIDDFRNFFSKDRVLEDFYVEEAVLKCLDIIKPNIDSNNIELALEIKNKYFVTGYKNEFFQVILNLLNNAVEALLIDKISKPKIKVKIRYENHNIYLDICDNAKGISSSIIDKIFNPYFTTKDSGTGLGLYMSKIIIEEHMDGKISVESSNHGTTSTIVLRGGLN